MNAGWMQSVVLLFAALAAGGVMAQGRDLRVTEVVAKLQLGKSSSKEVLDLLGKSDRVIRNERKGSEEWGYRMYADGERSTLWISMSADGVVREVLNLREPKPGM